MGARMGVSLIQRELFHMELFCMGWHMRVHMDVMSWRLQVSHMGI